MYNERDTKVVYVEEHWDTGFKVMPPKQISIYLEYSTDDGATWSRVTSMQAVTLPEKFTCPDRDRAEVLYRATG